MYDPDLVFCVSFTEVYDKRVSKVDGKIICKDILQLSQDR